MHIAYLLTRRSFFARLFGAVAVAALAGCGRQQPGVDAGTLEAVVDALIPADEHPGAVEAGVPQRILERTAGDPVGMNRYRRLLTWIERQSQELHQRPFKQLPPAERDRLLRDLHDSGGVDLAQLRIDLNVLLKHCFHEFYSSPAARQVIGYHPPIEGGYPDYARPPGPVG